MPLANQSPEFDQPPLIQAPCDGQEPALQRLKVINSPMMIILKKISVSAFGQLFFVFKGVDLRVLNGYPQVRILMLCIGSAVVNNIRCSPESLLQFDGARGGGCTRLIRGLQHRKNWLSLKRGIRAVATHLNSGPETYS